MNLNTGGYGLFDIQGKALHAIDVLNVARGETVADTIETTIETLNLVPSIPVSYEQAGSSLPTVLTGWQSSGGGLAQSLATFCQNILVAFVANDATPIDASLPAALDYLITQMTTDGDYVAANVVGGTLTAGGSNAGDTEVCWTLLDGDGESCQNAYAETITMTVDNAADPTRPSITCIGEAKVGLLDAGWPAGSGANQTIAGTDPASSLVAGGNFSDSTYSNIPEGWIVAVGTPGTTVLLTVPESQTVAIGGTPTGGSYILKYTDRDSRVWPTAAIAWSSTAGTVQSALRAIPDLAAVTVSATGTAPNYTHTIVFKGAGGDVAQLTSINLLTGGTPSITHATTVAGDAGDYRGTSLKLVGNSSTLITLYGPLSTLTTEAVYFAHLRLIRSGTATGAVIKAAIVDSIGGTALNDNAGNANELEIDAAALSDGVHTPQWFSFRLPASAVQPVYLRIAVTTAIPTGATIYVDEVAVAAGTQLYAGGPFVAAFAGRNAAQAGDYWTLAVTNDRAGLWQSWYNRAFAMADKGLLLPTSGSNLISATDLYPA